MSEAKFTKGPWQRDKYGTVIANGRTLLVTGVAIPCGYNKGESEANTNLIAAAPEMYNMISLLLTNSTFNVEHPVFAEELESLLAKARGEA